MKPYFILIRKELQVRFTQDAYAVNANKCIYCKCNSQANLKQDLRKCHYCYLGQQSLKSALHLICCTSLELCAVSMELCALPCVNSTHGKACELCNTKVLLVFLRARGHNETIWVIPLCICMTVQVIYASVIFVSHIQVSGDATVITRHL